MMRIAQLIAIVLMCGCSIEPITFTPLPDAAPPETCGDGLRQDDEVCDGADLAGADCRSAGDFTGGGLACDGDCAAFDTSGCDVTPSVPVLRQPLNETYLGAIFAPGSLRPRFEWGPSIAVGGAAVIYELQFTSDATFATGVTTVETMATSDRPAADLLVAQSAPVGTRYYWRVRACAGELCSASSSTWSVNLGRSDHDVNGDGFADVAIGASGRAYIYFGSAGAFDATADGTLTSPAGIDSFGAVASAGDVNGDGFADLVVGAPGEDVVAWAQAGKAYVYLGGPGATFESTADGTLTGPAAFVYLGVSVASSGDVNGDGFGDLVIRSSRSAHVYLGGPGATFDATVDATITLGDNGDTAAAAGDLNGDGFADVVVGAQPESGDGSAHVYFGGAGGGLFDVESDGVLVGPGDAQFGSPVASAGDVNCDGYADVLVGASRSDLVATNAGAVYVYFGAPGVAFDAVPESTLTGAAAGDWFGEAMSAASDLNGDGCADVVVGARTNDAGGDNAGRAYVFLGGAANVLDEIADGTLTGSGPSDALGYAVASAGDVNGDGFADLLVRSSAGSHLYLGGAGDTFDATADATLNPPP